MANKLLGLIRSSYVYLDNTTVKTLYTALVRPHLEYGNTAWCPVFRKDCEMLENAQRRATKLAPWALVATIGENPDLQVPERRAVYTHELGVGIC